ncbi:hypothetical protein [Pseudomonas brassicacearum]|uniref:hypothetical protein n=1 Tax=Pseudomonas brassicacearum TaxID=930166 RepID=UPI00218214DC|nr:hypothetical protein [Pseudomonas brassicacearum]
MAKSNADIQKDKRAKERALLERIGAEKRTLIVSKALADALDVLGQRHDFEEWQETVSTFLINLAAATAYESGQFLSGSRRPASKPDQLSPVALSSDDQSGQTASLGSTPKTA